MSKKRPYSHVKKQREIKELQNNVCIICWSSEKKEARGHHLIPYSEDGSDGILNFMTLCNSCHIKYHTRKLNIDIYRF